MLGEGPKGFTARLVPCENPCRQDTRTEIILKPEELRKLDSYFKQTFCQQMAVRARPHKNDSAEVYKGDEFLGVLFRDEEDGDLSFNFSMAILEMDLDDH